MSGNKGEREENSGSRRGREKGGLEGGGGGGGHVRGGEDASWGVGVMGRRERGE